MSSTQTFKNNNIFHNLTFTRVAVLLVLPLALEAQAIRMLHVNIHGQSGRTVEGRPGIQTRWESFHWAMFKFHYSCFLEKSNVYHYGRFFKINIYIYFFVFCGICFVISEYVRNCFVYQSWIFSRLCGVPLELLP